MQSDHKIDLQAFQLIVDLIYDAGNPEVMGSQLTHLLVSTMGLKGASVFIVNPHAEEMEILATEGLSLDYVNKGPILVDKSIKLTSNLKPVIISDIGNSDQLQYPEKARKEGVMAIVSLPINLKGKIIGALRVYHGEPWEVSEQDLSYLQLLAKYTGWALRYFRLSSVIQNTKHTLDDIHPIWL